MEKRLLLKCENIFKNFAMTKALIDVSLSVYRGEIRGLIGENGSGKSTLASVIAGVQPFDSGSMFYGDEIYKPQTMIEAQQKGISMVVQEMGTIPNITVAANIFIGKEKRFAKGLILNIEKMMMEAERILVEIGASDIDPKAQITSLNFEDRKIVEITRAMYDKPEILIIDETTTALSQKGRNIIYNIIKKMSAENKSVLFISHDLDELMSICDTVTILRDGQLISTMEHNEMNIHQMRTYMVGREISDNYYRIDYDGSYDNTVVFKGTNITSGPVLENFSFELHKGEILGIGGLSECGMHDLGRAIFGADRLITGSIYINGEKFVANPRRAIQNKIGYVSKNRDEEAVVLNDTIGNNIVLPSIPMLEKIFHISRKSERKLSVEMVNVMSIKCESIDQLVNQLSGGNKQKVVFAKWLGNNSDILILDCPTRGIDVGVKVAMYKLMYELKEQGKSIIMISEELPELIGMSDRLIILREGKISKQFTRNKSLSEVDIIQYMI